MKQGKKNEAVLKGLTGEDEGEDGGLGPGLRASSKQVHSLMKQID